MTQAGKLQNMCMEMFSTYYAGGTLISKSALKHCNLLIHLLCLCRAWKKHIKAAQLSNQIELYQMLCLLEGETNPATFTERMKQFITYWTPREPNFMQYFSQYYANRPGT